MANELFTTNKGTQIPVKEYSIDAATMTSLMRLQEDFVSRGEHLSLHGVVLHVVGKGIDATRNSWKYLARLKKQREFEKAVAPFMKNPAKYVAEIQELAVRFGYVEGTEVDLSEPELSDAELEKATAPSAESAATEVPPAAPATT